MIAIIAALPREVATLVKGVAPEPQGKALGVFVWRMPRTVVVAAGMGSSRAALAVQAALAMGDVSELWSVGLAGASDPGVRAGSVVEAAVVIDTRTGERFATSAPAGVVLATGSEIASVREKARLHASYGASVVDMEAATVARLAMASGLKFRAIKAVSDDASFELEGLGKFETVSGHFNTVGFALHTAVRPWMWGPAMTLGKHSTAALNALTAELNNRLKTQ